MANGFVLDRIRQLSDLASKDEARQLKGQILAGQIGAVQPIGSQPLTTPGIAQGQAGATQQPAGAALGGVSSQREQLAQLAQIAPQKAIKFAKALGIPLNQPDSAARFQNVKAVVSRGSAFIRAGRPDMAVGELQRTKQELNAQGITTPIIDQSIIDFQSDPEGESQAFLQLDQELRGMDTSGLTAGQQEFASLIGGLSEEDQERARRVKLGLDPRAGISAQERIAASPELAASVAEAGATIEGSKASAKETAKLSAQLKLEPEVKSAVTLAVDTAKNNAAQAEEERSNERAFAVYETAMGGLSEALGGTATGFFAGLSPGITQDQRIADGAVAAMAPVLKQLFRSAGEGNFTDADQRLLLEMVPTRKDGPKARMAKIKNIDTIVRAKLGVDGGSPQASAGAAPSQAGGITFLGFE